MSNPMKLFVGQGILKPEDVDVEDGGCAKIISIEPPEGCFFVRLQSWDETREHTIFNKMLGRKVRVTVEILEG